VSGWRLSVCLSACLSVCLSVFPRMPALHPCLDGQQSQRGGTGWWEAAGRAPTGTPSPRNRTGQHGSLVLQRCSPLWLHPAICLHDGQLGAKGERGEQRRGGSEAGSTPKRGGPGEGRRGLRLSWVWSTHSSPRPCKHGADTSGPVTSNDFKAAAPAKINNNKKNPISPFCALWEEAGEAEQPCLHSRSPRAPAASPHGAQDLAPSRSAPQTLLPAGHRRAPSSRAMSSTFLRARLSQALRVGPAPGKRRLAQGNALRGTAGSTSEERGAPDPIIPPG